MGVAVKLDEDLSPLVAEPLVEAGHIVATVCEQGWSGLEDSVLWSKLAAEQRLFITADKGFADLRAYPPGSHSGILILRPDRESILAYRALVQKVLAHHELPQLHGALTVASQRSVRIRRKTP